MDELEKLLGETEPETTPSEEEAPASSEEDQEVKAKAEQLENLTKAIAEAQGDLKKLRKAKREPVADDEDVLKIDLEVPNAKAWDSHIRRSVAPVAEEMEKEKEEVRTFALREFLKDHPDLAQSREKLAEVMGTYDRIKTSSERTREGVLIDLEKAYAAENYEALTQSVRDERIRRANGDMLFSEPAISRGSTTYSTEREVTPRINADDAAQLAKWNMTPKEYIDLKKKYG